MSVQWIGILVLPNTPFETAHGLVKLLVACFMQLQIYLHSCNKYRVESPRWSFKALNDPMSRTKVVFSFLLSNLLTSIKYAT